MSRGMRSRGERRGPMVVCVHIPRFELRVAAGGSEDLLGRALAIAPSGGGPDDDRRSLSERPGAGRAGGDDAG